MKLIPKPKTGEFAPYTIMYIDLLPDDGLVVKHLQDNLESTIKFDRVRSSVKASLFSPFNGLSVYPNNRRTNQAEEFMSFIASDTSMTEVIHRIDIPT